MSLKNFLLSWKNKKQLKKNLKESKIKSREIAIGITRLLLLNLFIFGFIYGIKSSNELFTLGVCISGILCIITDSH